MKVTSRVALPVSTLSAVRRVAPQSALSRRAGTDMVHFSGGPRNINWGELAELGIPGGLSLFGIGAIIASLGGSLTDRAYDRSFEAAGEANVIQVEPGSVSRRDAQLGQAFFELDMTGVGPEDNLRQYNAMLQDARHPALVELRTDTQAILDDLQQYQAGTMAEDALSERMTVYLARLEITVDAIAPNTQAEMRNLHAELNAVFEDFLRAPTPGRYQAVAWAIVEAIGKLLAVAGIALTGASAAVLLTNLARGPEADSH